MEGMLSFGKSKGKLKCVGFCRIVLGIYEMMTIHEVIICQDLGLHYIPVWTLFVSGIRYFNIVFIV